MDFLALSQTPVIADLDIHFNPDGWGPVNGEKLEIFSEVPYAHFDKKEKCGRHADFVMNAAYPTYQQKSSYQKRRDDYHQNNGFSFKHDTADDNTFQLVDTSKAQSKSGRFVGGGAAKRQQNVRGGTQQMNRGGQGAGGGGGGGRAGGGGGSGGGAGGGSQQQQQQRAQGGGGGDGQQRGWGAGRHRNKRVERQASMDVGGSWEVLEEFDLAQLLKLQANSPKVEELLCAGHLDQYDEGYDKLSTRTSRGLKRVENKFFCSVTTGEDPILQRLAVEQVGDVYATDAILAQLMAAPRSVYSWDILVEKVQGIVFLDKRDDNAAFDLLTVAETAQDPPSAAEDVEEINHPHNLSLEATMINQNFSQQILVDLEGERKSFEPNPFCDDLEPGMEPASVAYKYRLFALGDIKLVARCEMHCWATRRGEDQFVSTHALHEWDSRYSGGVNWRQKIDQQRGAVLATELKNNSCRLARWTAQSLLAGVDQMKLGYVSRVNPGNAYEHAILATQFFKPQDFAMQINLSRTNIWGIVKMICELLLNKPDGKYVLMKDPNKAILRLYAIPYEDEDDDEEDEEDGADDEEEEEEEEEGGGGGGGAAGSASTTA